MKKFILMAMVVAMLAFIGGAEAVMGGSMMGNGGGTIYGSAMMGGSMAMTNSSGFGMMNGMAGAPIVGDDGTAYVVANNPLATPGTVPSSGSFESRILAVKPTGEVITLTLKGIVSRPVVIGNVLVSTASLPDPANYNVVGNLGTRPSGQSVLYVLALPLTASSVPVALTLDGGFASLPVIANNHVYVFTSDFGSGMMTGNYLTKLGRDPKQDHLMLSDLGLTVGACS